MQGALGEKIGEGAYDPAVLAVIDRVLGTLVSVDEQSWLEGLRAVYAEEVPAFDGDRWPAAPACR